jgi:hypothetical protein
MISYEQAVKGVMRYVDNEMLPHMSGVKKIGLGAYAALAAKNAVQMLKTAAASPAVSITGAATAEGVDIDVLYNAISERMDGNVQLDVPMIGVFTVNRADVDKLYNYMRGAL